MCFYKFKPINKWLIDSIVNSNIYIPSFKELNDPFDCQIDIKKLLTDASSSENINALFIKNEISKNDFFSELDNLLSSAGVYSFSLPDSPILNEVLMWSHYADKHAGVCIEYNISKEKFKENIESDVDYLVTGKVDYESDKLLQNIINLPSESSHFKQGLLRYLLLSKSKSWSYENEARFVFKKPKIIQVPKNSIESVYFGLKAPDNDVGLIISLLKKYSGCTSFYKAIKGPGYHDIQFTNITS